MAWQTVQSVTSATPVTLFDKSVDGLGPLEWEISPTESINVKFSGIFPEEDTNVLYVGGETKYIASPTRGVTKIVAQAVSTTSDVTLRPSIG